MWRKYHVMTIYFLSQLQRWMGMIRSVREWKVTFHIVESIVGGKKEEMLVTGLFSRGRQKFSKRFFTLSLTTLKKKDFENIVMIGENAVIQHFLLFPQCFLPKSKIYIVHSATFILLPAIALNWVESKNLWKV